MDMEKFTGKLLSAKELKDIPAEFIFRVAFFILEMIKNGDVFKSNYGGYTDVG